MSYHILKEDSSGAIVKENSGSSYLLLANAPVNSLKSIKVNSVLSGQIIVSLPGVD